VFFSTFQGLCTFQSIQEIIGFSIHSQVPNLVYDKNPLSISLAHIVCKISHVFALYECNAICHSHHEYVFKASPATYKNLQNFDVHAEECHGDWKHIRYLHDFRKLQQAISDESVSTCIYKIDIKINWCWYFKNLCKLSNHQYFEDTKEQYKKFQQNSKFV